MTVLASFSTSANFSAPRDCVIRPRPVRCAVLAVQNPGPNPAMKFHPSLAVVLLVVAPAALPRTLAEESKSTPALNAVFVNPDAPEAAEIRKVGQEAIDRILNTMVNELRVALARGDLEAAVDVAHLKNVPMTGGRVTTMPRILAIKRTSFRLRSPSNAPDAADQLALDRVIKELASDYGAPRILIQRIDTLNAPPEWRVYSPLGAISTCLKCHGDPDLQPVGLREKLNAQYPTDQATGYRIGEWRGLLRVTVDATPPPPPAKLAPAKSTPAQPTTKPAPKK
jgi:hypothetical protein